MEIVSKKISVEEVTLTLSESDFKGIGEWQSALASATKENAYGLAKDLAGELERLLLYLTEGILPDKIASTKIVRDEKTQDKPICNRNPIIRTTKRPSNQTTQQKKIKVTITNIDDNHVFQTVVRMLGRFVKRENFLSIQAQLKKDKGAIYLDNEQELDDLLNTLLVYNLSDGHVPIQIQVE